MWRAGAIVVAIALVGSTGSPASDNRIVVQPAKFTNLPRGWKAFDSDFGFLTSRGANAYSYALSWRWQPNSFGWATQMPRGAIAVTVSLIRRSPGKTKTNLCLHVPRLSDSPKIRRLPLQLPATTPYRLEGEPGVIEYRVFGRMDDSYDVDLRVDVNSRHPSETQRQSAQNVVSHLRFPTWPRKKRC